MEESGIKNVFNLINSYSPQFTKSEKNVARLVLRERENITNMSLADISRAAQVSETSVLRFCAKIGFRRLLDLKIQIAKDSSESDAPESSGDTQEDEFLSVIRNTASLLDRDRIRQAVDMIEEASQLSFYGIAASGISARAGEDCFQRMGVPSSTIVEDHFQIFRSARMDCRDLIIAFSLSGNTAALCEACQLGRSNGAKVIAITSYPNSRLASISDVVLLTSAKEDLVDGGKITAYASQLYVLDALKREYFSRHKEAVVKLKEVIGAAIITKKY